MINRMTDDVEFLIKAKMIEAELPHWTFRSNSQAPCHIGRGPRATYPDDTFPVSGFDATVKVVRSGRESLGWGHASFVEWGVDGPEADDAIAAARSK